MPQRSTHFSSESRFHILISNSLRSFISALFWFTIGVAAAICIALSPVSQDPYLVWMYAGLGITGFVAGCAFFVCFRKSRKLREDVVILEAELVETHGNEYQDKRGGIEKA